MPDRDMGSDAWTIQLRHRLDELIDEYRAALDGALEGLTESEARLRLVPSNTTLLGLVRHATFVEGVWFEQAVSGHTAQEAGIASSSTRSYTLRKSDTIESVRTEYQRRCETSRGTIAALDSDAVMRGRGRHAVWSLQLQVLRELALHTGHAEILREQILARRTG